MMNIVGAGLAGLSAALTFAGQGVPVRLVSFQPSERAQSNLAEGGINAALDVMGEGDCPAFHFEDTMRGGCSLADPNMVRGLTEAAPGIVRQLCALGVPFHREDGHLMQRNFGGQKKKRTAYAMSSTGKVLMAAMIDAVRRFEAQGLVARFPHHCFEKLLIKDGTLCGAQVLDRFTGQRLLLDGPVLMSCGGMNGLFAGATTGTTANTGSAAAMLFAQGVTFANLEFLQYHPTTASITGKRLLISEAARGEGGRLFYVGEDGQNNYFLEEKYGPRGNLMPRDVISREMAFLGKQVYLDLTGLDAGTWREKLSDLREEIRHYLGIDAACEPVPVSPGIHYFMGGILTDEGHRTSLPGLYAAGECACAYHGANRLGGNSLLGAIYGGKKAAQSALEDLYAERGNGQEPGEGTRKKPSCGPDAPEEIPGGRDEEDFCARPQEHEVEEAMTAVLLEGLSPLRDEASIKGALEKLRALQAPGYSGELSSRLLLARAMLLCALERKESRGAHTRTDYPEQREEFRKTTAVQYRDGEIRIEYRTIPEAALTG